MRSIFISYRREDAEGQAGRLFADLVARFGTEAVFMDVVDIEPGRDFRRVIDEHVASCAVLLTVIGKGWINATDQAGRRRLDNPNDFVRLETASALKRDIPVIPVLVQGARMPDPKLLPEDLKNLAYRNSVELTHARWDSDIQVLIKGLGRAAPVSPRSWLNRKWLAMAAIVLVLGGSAFFLWRQERWPKPPREVTGPVQQAKEEAARKEAADKTARHPSLIASIVPLQAIPLAKVPHDWEGQPVFAESARCQVTFGHDQSSEAPIRVTSITVEHEAVPLTEMQRTAINYDIDAAMLVGHGIVEERLYEFEIAPGKAIGKYLVDKDLSEPVPLANILARRGAGASVSIAGKAEEAHFGFAAMVNLLGTSSLRRVRFIATYDVAGLTGQRASTRWIYVYRK